MTMDRHKLFIWIYGVFLPVVLQDVISTYTDEYTYRDILDKSQIIPQSAKATPRLPGPEESTTEYLKTEPTSVPQPSVKASEISSTAMGDPEEKLSFSRDTNHETQQITQTTSHLTSDAHPPTSHLTSDAHPPTSHLTSDAHPPTSHLTSDAHPPTSHLTSDAHPPTSHLTSDVHPPTSHLTTITHLPSTLPMKEYETTLSSVSQTSTGGLNHTPDVSLVLVTSPQDTLPNTSEENEMHVSPLSNAMYLITDKEDDASVQTQLSDSYIGFGTDDPQTQMTEGVSSSDDAYFYRTTTDDAYLYHTTTDDAYLYRTTTEQSVSKQPTSTTTYDWIRFSENPEAINAKTTTPAEFSNTHIGSALLFHKQVTPSTVSLPSTTVFRETDVVEESETDASHSDGYLSKVLTSPDDSEHSPEHSVSILQDKSTQEDSSKYTNPSHAEDNQDPIPNLHQEKDPAPLHAGLPSHDLESTITAENGYLEDTTAEDRPGLDVSPPLTTSINSSDEHSASAEQLLGNLTSLTREEVRTAIDRHLGPVLISAMKTNDAPAALSCLNKSTNIPQQEERNSDRAHMQSLDTGNDIEDTEPGFDAATRCYTGKMDLAILVDASDDFRKRDMIRLQRFIIKLLRPYKFGEENIKLSMITFNTKSHLVFDFEQFDHDLRTGGRSAVESRIRKNLKPGGHKNTASVLHVTNKLFGECGDRNTVPNLVLLITGGALLEGNREQTLQEAMTLKQNGIRIVGLVVGQCDGEEIHDFKSVVLNSQDAICVKTSKLLPSFSEELREKLCREIASTK